GTEDVAHHHTAELTGGRGYSVYLKASHGQARDLVVAGNLRVHPPAQPLFTESHVLSLLSKGVCGYGVSETGQGSADRCRRTGADRSRRNAAWPDAPRPCRRQSPETARGRCPSNGIRSGAPCRNP